MENPAIKAFREAPDAWAVANDLLKGPGQSAAAWLKEGNLERAAEKLEQVIAMGKGPKALVVESLAQKAARALAEVRKAQQATQAALSICASK